MRDELMRRYPRTTRLFDESQRRAHIAASELLGIDLEEIEDKEELRTIAYEMQAQLALFNIDNERLAEAVEGI